MTARADRMAALERLAAPGSGATDPERDTARRILERMRAEGPAVPEEGDANLWSWFADVGRRAGVPFPGPFHPQCRCTVVPVDAADPFGAYRFTVDIPRSQTASAATAEAMAKLAELLGYAPRRGR